jgi:hypothetical protein
MTTLATVIPHQDEEAWHEARRGPRVTATQVRDWAKGYPADRSRILIEKITGVREDLEAVKYIEWGKFREPFMQDWVLQKYGIEPVQNDLYISGEDERWACTPDGYSSAFGHITLSELKTSKHNLHPDNGQYLTTGYDDQMQWEMLVTGADEVLFVWEQHNDDWNPWPEPFAPQAVWIKRDPGRIEILKKHAEELLLTMVKWQLSYDAMLDKCVTDEERVAAETALIEALRADYTSSHGLEDRWLFIVGGDKVPDSDDPLALGQLPPTLAELAAIVVEARAEEAAAIKRKTEAWRQIQELTKERGDFKAYGHGYSVSWSTTRKTKQVIDVEKMRAKAPAIVAKYEDLQTRYTREEPYESRTMNVTKQD